MRLSNRLERNFLSLLPCVIKQEIPNYDEKNTGHHHTMNLSKPVYQTDQCGGVWRSVPRLPIHLVWFIQPCGDYIHVDDFLNMPLLQCSFEFQIPSSLVFVPFRAPKTFQASTDGDAVETFFLSSDHTHHLFTFDFSILSFAQIHKLCMSFPLYFGPINPSFFTRVLKYLQNVIITWFLSF